MGFRKTGGSYARKGGSNANDGLTQSTPKATISAGIGVGTGDVIVLSGEYREAPSLNAPKTIVGDGLVKIIAPVTGSSNISFGAGGGTCRDVSLLQFNNINLTNSNSLVGCVVSCISLNWAGGITFSSNTFIGIQYGTIGSGIGGNFTGNKLISCRLTINPTVNFNSNYADVYSVLKFEINALFSTALKNNCIAGLVDVGGVYHVVPQAIDIIGVDTVRPFAERQGTYPSGAVDWLHVGMKQTANQCYAVNKNFNADPQFNDVANYDFTVAPTSPFIDRLEFGQNLCGVKVATPLKANAFAKTNLSGTNDLTVESPNTIGFATSPTITIDSINARTLGAIQYIGALNFDALAAGGTATNDNVPKTTVYTKNGQSVTSTSPRPSVLIRWSTRTDRAPNADIDSDWGNENVNGVLSGEWVLAELNTDFLVDSQGWGNGDERFNPLAAQAIQATYYQIRVTLTDAYNNG